MSKTIQRSGSRAVVAVLVTLVAGANFAAAQVPTRTLQVEDVVGGNDKYLEVPQPDPNQPIPLPNPAVFQLKPTPAQSKTVVVKLGVDQRTEIKAVLDKAQVIVYSWKSDGGAVYTDFHGHAPNTGKAFVRYQEQQSGKEGYGSLVAPFAGEHGWYWRNISPAPITITLQVNGYFREIVDHGLLK